MFLLSREALSFFSFSRKRIERAALISLLCLSAAPGALSHDDTSGAAVNNGKKVYIEELDLSFMSQGHGNSHKKASLNGNAIIIGGKQHEHGVGTHAPGELSVNLKGCAREFNAVVGIDDETRGKGAAVFQVWVDGEKKYDSGIMHGGDTPKSVHVDLKGGKHLLLELNDVDANDQSAHADWADAAIIFEEVPDAPKSMSLPEGTALPIAAIRNDTLAVNSPRIVGATPGHPFLFRVPATGKGDLKFAAHHGLPEGLKLDAKTGIITGSLKSSGAWTVKLSVADAHATVNSDLKIVGGKKKLALTPPMGWNSWNVFGRSVDGQKIRQAADWLVKSGLANHGYQYINIDDGWQGKRNAKGEIEPNEKFGDMKALADYVHEKGLKLGIYSSPGPKTCGGFEGSLGHEAQDARSYAAWGVDYLKYDLCSYAGMLPKNAGIQEMKKPYEVMAAALGAVKRDIVYSLCQYGLGSVWEWGESVGGNLWRTTGDIGDKWGTISRLGFGEAVLQKYAGPGHWNDPDMLVVGHLGKGWQAEIHPSDLNHNEQITHLTLWSILAAPLLIGCDLSTLDQFTLDLLGNDEVIAIDQDALGQQGAPRVSRGMTEVWTKQLSDGSTAVALFNRAPHAQKISASWAELGLKPDQHIRDLWLRENLGVEKTGIARELPPHAAALFKVSQNQPIQ